MASRFGNKTKEILTFTVKPHNKLNSFKINFPSYRKIKKDDPWQLFNETEVLEDYTFIYEGNNREEDYAKLKNIIAEINENFDLRKRRSKYRPTATTNDSVSMIEDMRIEANELSDNFKFTLIYDKQKISFPISIKTKSKKPKSIQKGYSKFYTKYKKAYSARAKIWDCNLEKREADLKIYIDNLWAGLEEGGFIDKDGNIAIPRNTFGFGIGGLGIINCDRPLLSLPLDPLQEVLANYFDIKTKDRIYPRSVYVLDYTKNYSLNYRNNNRPEAYQKSNVILVVILKDRHYGIVENFNEIRLNQDKKRKLDIAMEVFDNSISFNERLLPYAMTAN